MIEPFAVDDVLNSPSKLAVLRILASRKGFKATGREIAKLSGYSPPSAHETLKDLHARDVLTLEVIGKQHVYSLNEASRIVLKVIRPMFQVEGGFKEEIRDFLLTELKKLKNESAVTSMILFGSLQKETAKEGSDVDVAVVVSRTANVERIEEEFLSVIAPHFKEYFGIQLDAYVKSALNFRQLRRKNRPPVSTLMQSYSVLYGKEPLEI